MKNVLTENPHRRRLVRNLLFKSRDEYRRQTAVGRFRLICIHAYVYNERGSTYLKSEVGLRLPRPVLRDADELSRVVSDDVGEDECGGVSGAEHDEPALLAAIRRRVVEDLPPLRLVLEEPPDSRAGHRANLAAQGRVVTFNGKVGK